MSHGDDWDQHWEEFAGSIARNPAQEFRRRLVVRHLAAEGPPARLVDIGSGSGDLAAALRAVYPATEILGLELSSTGIEHARRKVPDAVFLQSDLTVGGVPPEQYRGWGTHAVCSEVLEHVDAPDSLLLNSLPFLAPGCLLVVTVPGGPMTAFDRHIGHRRHFRPRDLDRLLRAVGFETVRAWGAGFPSFNAYRLFLLALGRRVIDHAGSPTPSAPARAATAFFETLMCRNLGLSRLGWQTIATARLPYAPRA